MGRYTSYHCVSQRESRFGNRGQAWSPTTEPDYWHLTQSDDHSIANLYLASFGAEPFADDAPRIVGLSEETTCHVSTDYFQPSNRFEVFVVHEAAHIFQNCKRRSIGLLEIRRREWLLQLEFAKRETFAYACEAYTRILEHGGGPAERRLLLAELVRYRCPADDYLDADEFIDTLRSPFPRRSKRPFGAYPRESSAPRPT